MKHVIKWRWGILAAWLAATLLLTVFQPDVNAILRQRGQDPLTSDSPSKVASTILNKMNDAIGASNIIVFHDPDKLSDEALKRIESSFERLKQHQGELGIDQMLDPFSMPDAKSSLISEDQTTLMASFSLDKKDREIDDIQREIDEVLQGVNVPYYLSGEDFIQNDYLKASTAGVEKSAILTVVFILAVLIIMFRSVIIPFVSLAAVGVSYAVSMGIAAQIIDKLNFPVTSVTQMLLVLILFGIGTDYNILLFNRFKEELAHGRSTDEAIIETYRTAGKTIFYSILTVFIAFAGLSFSSFGIYKSANVVAIGTVVLLLEIVTLTPFLMKTLGGKLFWPSKHATGHKESRFWAKLTSTSVKRPIVVTALIVLVMVPALLFSKQNLSFDQLGELGDGYPSTKGFSLVAEHFSRGQALPTTVVIESDKALDNNDAMAVMDKLTEKLKSVDGVKQVASITQPQSKPIDEFYISSQTGSVTEGIAASKQGVSQIQDGLGQMQSQLASPDFASVDQLVAGTGDVQAGYAQIASALGQVAGGVQQSAGGAGELRDGIARVKVGLEAVHGSSAQLSAGLGQLQQGFGALGGGYKQLEGQIPAIQQGLSGMNGLIGGLGAKYSQLSGDADYLTLKQTGEQLESGVAQLSGGLKELNASFAKLESSLGESAAGLGQIASAQAELSGGLAALESGADELAKGLQQGSDGGKQLEGNMYKLNAALASIQDGQKQLNNGLSALTGGMSQLKDGLGKSGAGLGDISDGLGKTGDFLQEYSASRTFFMPKAALESEDFKRAADNFMSKDRKIAKWIVILEDDPYSMEAMETIERINRELESGVQGTVLADAKYGAAGPSSTTYDTNAAQLQSFNSTAVIVIVGVFLVLLLVIRSLWPTLIIIGSLIASYYVAMTASKLVAYGIIGAEGVSSFVPFFSFIVIVAVGVDYSIFLMMRYKEYGELSPSKAIVEAAKHVGGVVISAMVILGGTFATLIPSGLVLLIELASAVIVGLLVLCYILLPMLLPAMMALPEALRNRTSGKQ